MPRRIESFFVESSRPGRQAHENIVVTLPREKQTEKASKRESSEESSEGGGLATKIKERSPSK